MLRCDRHVPDGWLPCDGSVVSIDQYPELYDSMKLCYKDKLEDDIESFQLPNLEPDSDYKFALRYLIKV